MPEALHVRRFTANYKLKPAQFQELPRLDALLRTMMSEALELALERAGVRASEIVCIRRIQAPVRLRLSLADSALVAAWANAIAEAIAQGVVPAVRYRSRAAALVEMGRCIADGHFENVWAWRQLGFWRIEQDYASSHDAAREFARALCGEPEAAVPVLVTLATVGALPRLLEHLEDELMSIAAAALRGSGIYIALEKFTAHTEPGQSIPWPAKQGPAQPALSETPSAISTAAPAPEPPPELREALQAERVKQRSRILSACELRKYLSTTQAALAALALLECEPALTQSGPERFTAVARALRTLASTQPLPLPVLEPTAQPDAPAARTGYGGLLYLINVIDALRIPARIIQTEVFAQRGFAWCLHRLALTLQPIAPGDPAALAFCGLVPNTTHPSHNEPRPTPEEQLAIDEYATEIRSHLAALFPEESPHSPESILQTVCRRDAEIVADPGWIEVRFSLRDVSTAIRRAGLDLDPNYVPWLGIVLRYVYE